MKKIDRSNCMMSTVFIFASLVMLPICQSGIACPDGAFVHQDHSQRCASTEIMFGNDHLCCNKAVMYLCKQTGMVSRILYRNYFYEKKPLLTNKKYTAESEDYVYELTAENGKTFVCPYPIGYLWYTQFPTLNHDAPPNFLPTDFVETTVKLKTCNRNGECEIDEFCGDVINRSYDGKYGRLKPHLTEFCTQQKAAQDKCLLIYDGLPFVEKEKRFCYKAPEIIGDTSKNIQYWSKTFERSFELCDLDESCGAGRKCLLSKTQKWSRYNSDTDKREEFHGICIESLPISYTFFKIYESLSAVSKQESIGRQYLPVDSHKKRRDVLETCNKNWDCQDQEFCGHVHSLAAVAPTDTADKYCYKVPEDHPNAFVKPDGVDLMVCETNEDCDGITCDTSAHKTFLSKVNGQQKVFTGICSKTPNQEEDEEEDSSLIIIIVILVTLIVVIFATLIGGFVLFKLKKKPNNCATETTSGGKKNKKAKKEKKNKKPSGKTSTTTKSLSVTGKSGMGTTTGGYSPAIF